MIPWWKSWELMVGFAVGGCVYELVGRGTGWYHPYPWSDLPALCFGYLCGAMAMRRHANRRPVEGEDEQERAA